ncbi:MAG: hypothetical protein HYT80_09445 [Euryarchaeota archaeon]|nr:hypothetical protein [Euryarchaeota archaeon]
MNSVPILLAAVLVTSFASGCLRNDAKAAEAADGDESGHGGDHHAGDHVRGGSQAGGHMQFDLSMLNDFNVEFKNCREGGGVSLYNLDDGTNRPPVGAPAVLLNPTRVQGPTRDFNRTSISDDTGDPKLGSYFTPIRGSKGTTGIWHTALTCAGHSLNGKDLGPYEGGWVGVRVEKPRWDTSDVARHYFVADLSFNQKEIKDLIHHATGLHASLNLDAKVDVMNGDVMHTILDDEDHGVFETHGRLKDWKPKDSLETMRFWMLINPEGHGHAGEEGSNPPCKCIPISFDVKSVGGTYRVIDGTGYLSHSRTDAHGNQPVAHGNVGGMAYLGFDRTMELGPMPDLILEQTWLH